MCCAQQPEPMIQERKSVVNMKMLTYIRISVFADDMSTVGDAGEIRKRIRNCMKMETLKMIMD